LHADEDGPVVEGGAVEETGYKGAGEQGVVAVFIGERGEQVAACEEGAWRARESDFVGGVGESGCVGWHGGLIFCWNGEGKLCLLLPYLKLGSLDPYWQQTVMEIVDVIFFVMMSQGFLSASLAQNPVYNGAKKRQSLPRMDKTARPAHLISYIGITSAKIQDK